MFLVKKIISAFLYPLPICLLVLMAGVVLLWRGKQTWGRRLVTLGVVVLLLCSIDPLSKGVVVSLEQRYEPFSPARYAGAEVQWVVVLSAGMTDHPAQPSNSQLSATSLARLVEGLRVLRFYPEARLLLSGRGYFTTIPAARAMRDVALFLGTDSTRIVLEDRSFDTADQAVNVREIVGEQPMVLVTSALHMPRSMALFEGQGMTPLPAPANPLVDDRMMIGFDTFVPSSGEVWKLRVAWHEYLGLLWAKLRGQA